MALVRAALLFFQSLLYVLYRSFHMALLQFSVRRFLRRAHLDTSFARLFCRVAILQVFVCLQLFVCLFSKTRKFLQLIGLPTH